MKKSEFGREFLRLWQERRDGQLPAYWQDSDEAQAAIAAAEAAGVVWDPETVPLPESLHLQDGIAFEPGSVPNAYAVFALCRTNSYPGQREHAARVTAEAVRRWNAWRSIRRCVELWANGPSTADDDQSLYSDLLAILDGKEGE